MEINEKKMVKVTSGEEVTEQIREIKYLGSIVSEALRCEPLVKSLMRKRRITDWRQLRRQPFISTTCCERHGFKGFIGTAKCSLFIK